MTKIETDRSETARIPRAVYVLSGAVFVLGTSEFGIAGLLPEIATNLAVSLPSAGLLISAYAGADRAHPADAPEGHPARRARTVRRGAGTGRAGRRLPHPADRSTGHGGSHRGVLGGVGGRGGQRGRPGAPRPGAVTANGRPDRGQCAR